MKGLQLLLQSMGIKIDPQEIETAWTQAKDALPKLAASFQELETRQKRIEEKLDKILSTPCADGYSLSEFWPDGGDESGRLFGSASQKVIRIDTPLSKKQ